MTAPWIQLIRPLAYGDILMTTATFAGLRAQGYRLRYAVAAQYADILTAHPLIERVVTVPNIKNNNMWRRRRLHQIIAEQIAAEDAPAKIVDFTNPKNRAILRRPLNALSPRLAHRLMPMSHVLELYCREAGVPLDDQLTLGLTEDELAWGRRYADAILIQPFSSNLLKDWPVSRWQQLIAGLETTGDRPIYQLCAPQQAGLDGIPKLNNPTLRHAFAALAASRLLIGGDSVFNHASRAVNTPALVLWGPTHPSRFGYRQNVNLWDGQIVTPSLGGTPWDPAALPDPAAFTNNANDGAQPQMAANSVALVLAMAHAMLNR